MNGKKQTQNKNRAKGGESKTKERKGKTGKRGSNTTAQKKEGETTRTTAQLRESKSLCRVREAQQDRTDHVPQSESTTQGRTLTRQGTTKRTPPRAKHKIRHLKISKESTTQECTRRSEHSNDSAPHPKRSTTRSRTSNQISQHTVVLRTNRLLRLPNTNSTQTAQQTNTRSHSSDQDILPRHGDGVMPVGGGIRIWPCRCLK